MGCASASRTRTVRSRPVGRSRTCPDARRPRSQASGARRHGLGSAAAGVPRADHYSVAKAVTMLGIGLDNLVRVAVDERGRMDPQALREAVAKDLAAGHEPMMVNATAGPRSSAPSTPSTPSPTSAATHWLHVDGAFGAPGPGPGPGASPAGLGARGLDGRGRPQADGRSAPARWCSSASAASGGQPRGERELPVPGGRRRAESRTRFGPVRPLQRRARRGRSGSHSGTRSAKASRGSAARLCAAGIVRSAPGLELVREPESSTSASGSRAPTSFRGARSRPPLIGYALVDGEKVVRLTLSNAVVDEEDLRLLFRRPQQAASECAAVGAAAGREER